MEASLRAKASPLPTHSCSHPWHLFPGRRPAVWPIQTIYANGASFLVQRSVRLFGPGLTGGGRTSRYETRRPSAAREFLTPTCSSCHLTSHAQCTPGFSGRPSSTTLARGNFLANLLSPWPPATRKLRSPDPRRRLTAPLTSFRPQQPNPRCNVWGTGRTRGK